MTLVYPMPRLVEGDGPIPSRQHLVSISPVQARYHGGERAYDFWGGIVHMTEGGTLESSEGWVNRDNVPRKERASWHLGIDRFGQMRRFLGYEFHAFHAGPSKWHALPGQDGSLNYRTIGLEIANRNGLDGKHEPVGLEQYLSAVWACAVLAERFGFPGSHWLGHHEVSPGRKTDPDRKVFCMQSFRADVVEEMARRRRWGRAA